MDSVRARGWRLFDAIVKAAALDGYSNPWVSSVRGGVQYEPDYSTLRRLLGVPVLLGAESRSGVPALALDVWVAFELRRCGFDPDAVWPRAQAPRVLPTEVRALLETKSLPKSLREKLKAQVDQGKIGSASANILGKNYVKQVDVGVSAWHTGPELLISTKRMDSSFGKNAANRVEESYGDAKNLRLRYPQAALGFLYGLRSTALTEEPDKALWLIDLLAKLGEEDDAYHAVALVIPEWGGETAEPEADSDIDYGENALVAAGVEADPLGSGEPADLPDDVVAAELARLPEIRLRRDAVPPELDPARFLSTLVTRVLRNSPITFHQAARQRREDGKDAGHGHTV